MVFGDVWEHETVEKLLLSHKTCIDQNWLKCNYSVEFAELKFRVNLSTKIDLSPLKSKLRTKKFH
jgi:hypothetical protein